MTKRKREDKKDIFFGMEGWTDVESDHEPHSYQECVLPLNYPSNYHIVTQFVIRNTFYHINSDELISLTSLGRSYYSRVARGVIELSVQGFDGEIIQ